LRFDKFYEFFIHVTIHIIPDLRKLTIMSASLKMLAVNHVYEKTPTTQAREKRKNSAHTGQN